MRIAKEDLQMLEEIRQTYVRSANNIPDWKTMDKSKLANLYLEYENIEPERSYYFSALMCRYWKNVYNFYKTSQSTRLEIGDFTSWLAESFFVAFKYRKWKDPKSKLFNDPQAPDKVINRCIYSTRMRYYQYFNMDKRKLNFQTDSIERQLEAFGHLANVYGYLGTYDTNKEGIEVINHYLSQDNIFNAIILDLICFGDTFREIKNTDRVEIKTSDIEDEPIETIKDEQDKELYDEFFSENVEIGYDQGDLNGDFTGVAFESDDENIEFGKDETVTKVTYRIEFSLRKLLSELRELDEDYIKYFFKMYQVDEAELRNTVVKIKELDDRNKLSRVVNKIIDCISKDKKVSDMLCL